MLYRVWWYYELLVELISLIRSQERSRSLSESPRRGCMRVAELLARTSWRVAEDARWLTTDIDILGIDDVHVSICRRNIRYSLRWPVDRSAPFLFRGGNKSAPEEEKPFAMNLRPCCRCRADPREGEAHRCRSRNAERLSLSGNREKHISRRVNDLVYCGDSDKTLMIRRSSVRSTPWVVSRVGWSRGSRASNRQRQEENGGTEEERELRVARWISVPRGFLRVLAARMEDRNRHRLTRS